MAVVASGAAEVVRYAGGWLFDQGMAGWDVNVLISEHDDHRPLRILGARAHDLETALTSPAILGPCLRTVVFPADLYHRDVRIRQIGRNALEAGAAELRLWADPPLAQLDRGADPVSHRLSIAARAFKAHALAAAYVAAEATADIETFHRLRSQVPATPTEDDDDCAVAQHLTEHRHRLSFRSWHISSRNS